MLFDILCSFANDLDISDHGILNLLILQKGDLGQVFGVALNAADRLKNYGSESQQL